MSHPSAPLEEPPTYDEAQQGHGAPPSYEELFGEFSRVNTPGALAQFVYKTVNVIADTVAAAVVLALLNIIPILMVVIGSINREKCPINKNIPTWLIVAGTCALTRSAINFVYRFRDQQHRVRPLQVRCFESLLSIFIFIWFILGSIWVYWSYSRVSYDETKRDYYCDQATYLFAFIFITVTYVLAFITCFCFCCCCCCICFRRPQENSQVTVHIAP